MSKINCHLFLSVLGLLVLNPLINQIQPNLHLPYFSGRVSSLPLLHTAVALAKIHQFICLFQEAIKFSGNFLIDSCFSLSVELAFSEL